MNNQEFILIDTFCQQHELEISFINSLQDFGLIEVVQINEVNCISVSQLVEVEKIIRLHKDLEINNEGIDVVLQLLQRINNMQNEIILLKNKLNLYEDE